MASKTRYGSVRRFGARYGRTVRQRLGKIEAEQRKKHVCPYCNKTNTKRLAAGIWYCGKEGKKFTSRAYVVGKTVVKDILIEAPSDASEEKVSKDSKAQKGD